MSSIDLEAKKLITDDGDLSYDYLVLAPGSTTNFYNQKDAEEHALPLKTLRDGIAIHNRIIDAYEGAMLENDIQRRLEWLTFVVVGGGATGVELTASLQDFVSHALARDYPQIKPSEVRVVQIEAGGQFLSGLSPALAKEAWHKLTSRGVEIRLDTAIRQVNAHQVITSQGEVIPTRTTIWLAGVKPPALIEALPLAKAKDGRLVVSNYLEVSQYPEVYVVGDCAFFAAEGGGPLPPKGQVAVPEGRAAGRDIIRRLQGRPRQPFQFSPQIELVYLGRNAAVAQLWGQDFGGFPASLLWRTIYLTKLAGFRNKLSVALDWSFTYFSHRSTARLE